MPKVSVLIPTYNRQHYLGEAIRSVQAQTCSDWELVVADDGSGDDTRAVVEACGGAVRYLYQPNQGVSSARNLAFRESTGEYVLFLDSDDTLLPNALADLSAALDANPACDVVYSDGYVMNEDGNRCATLSDYGPRPFVDTLEAFVVGSPLGLASTMIRRTALQRIEGPFDPQMVGYEDWDMFLRLKAAGCAFHFVPSMTYCYRFHGGNKSAPKSPLSEKRRRSLVHSRMKAMNTPWFAGLSPSTHYAFFEDLLTTLLSGDRARQDEVMSHPAFLHLPVRARSALLYRLTVNNILSSGSERADRQRLWAAIRLHPTNAKSWLLLALALAGHGLPERALSHWRKTRGGQDATDPVTQILRSKNVA